MEHLARTELIDLIRGRVPDERRPRMEQHVAACESCRTLRDECARLYDVLGEWTEDGGDADLWPVIEQRLNEPTIIRIETSRSRIAALGRVAAMVALGVGLGAAGGFWSARSAPPAVPPIDETTAVENLGLTLLFDTSATGLPITLVELEDDQNEIGGAS